MFPTGIWRTDTPVLKEGSAEWIGGCRRAVSEANWSDAVRELCGRCYETGNAATGRLNGRILVALPNSVTRKRLPLCGFLQAGLRLGTICARCIGTDVHGRRSIPSDRQHANAVTKGVHGNQSASFEVWFSGLDCPEHDIANRGRENVLGADLNHTGPACP
jgi:hypothetical protein